MNELTVYLGKISDCRTAFTEWKFLVYVSFPVQRPVYLSRKNEVPGIKQCELSNFRLHYLYITALNSILPISIPRAGLSEGLIITLAFPEPTIDDTLPTLDLP